MAKSKQTIQPLKSKIDAEKSAFITSLRSNGGNVSEALESSSLNRKTAYDHFKTDKEFASKWLEALEASNDDLFAEARRRATVDKSDTLLIYLLKHSEAQKKWRQRIIQTGNIAMQSVSDKGRSLGLTDEQIISIQTEMQERFQSISLI